MASSRPHVILSAAMSLDGKIATISGDSRLSSERDLVRVHKLRSKADAILVGKNTVVRDDPLLSVRLVRGKNPTRIVLDSMASMPLGCRILQTCSHTPTIIAVSKSAPKNRLARLARLPVEIITAGEKSVSLRRLMAALHKRKIRTVLVEGGGEVNWAFIKAGLWDELHVAVSPFVLGGTDAVSLVQGSGFKTVRGSAKLHLDSVTRMEDHVILHYTRQPGHAESYRD